MPTSRPYHLAWLSDRVLNLRPSSILDIGIGFGSKGMLFREYTDVWYGNYFNWLTRIDGVEIFEKYVTDLQHKIYDNIYIGNILDIVDKLGSYDLIYMGDVIEHLPKEKGLECIQKLKLKCKNLIIVTPVAVSKQGAVYGNEHETHISEYKPIDFGKGVRTRTFGNMQVINWEKPTVYYCDGMKFYGERIKKMGFGEYMGVGPALFMGLYFDKDYQVYRNHEGVKYVFWNGSDVSRLLNMPTWQNILLKNPGIHICHNSQLAQELQTVGIEPLIEPIFFADINDYQVSFKPKKQLEVYINAHPGRREEYGIPMVVEASSKLPDVKFFVYGIEGEDTDNLFYMGWLEELEADKKMKRHHVCLRLNKHDGLSQLIIKAALWGHYVITVQEMENTIRIKDISELIEKIKGLQGITEPQLSLRDRLIKSNLNKFSWL